MVVGPGEADRYLPQVLDRAQLWADDIVVAVDPLAGEAEREVVASYASAWQVVRSTWAEHEGRFRAAAWELLVTFGPELSDFIVTLDSDEVIADHGLVRMAATEYSGHQVFFTFHEMWSPNEYRIDGHWKPYRAGIMFPFRRGGQFVDKPLACGREPTYVKLLPKSRPVADVLHYGYAKPEDRRRKFDRYMSLDGGKYHDLSHLKSILYEPSLQAWNKGGLLDA